MKNVRVRNQRDIGVGKILCLGKNYAAHAREMKSDVPAEPVVFLKPSSSIIADGEDIVIPPFSREVHHEVELVMLIGSDARNVSQEDARQFILGYGVGLDMTLRDVQAKAKQNGLPWTVAKGFETSAPVSEFVPAQEIGNIQDIDIRCTVNGSVRQQSSVSNMIFSVEEIVSYLSSIFTLEAGDLVFTGTPEGVAEVKPGDIVEAELIGYTKTTHSVKAGYRR
jgi:acylpyruvate hydrolase